MTAQDLPLKGIRVIDYSHFLAGPFMGRCLAAMGAEVIKVERPKQGDAGRAHGYFKDGQSGYFLQQNMGKQGLCIDLRDKRGLDLMMKLVDTADVFIENYRPGALERLGLGYKALSARNPGLIYCSVSAYGHTGPYADRPGFGLIAEAMSGALAQLGNPGEAPPLLRMPLADMYTGIHGVAAINAVLVGRASSGRGQHIDLALYDCMVSMHDYAVQRYFLSGGTDLPKQTGSGQPESTVYGVFPARDGNLVIAAQVDDAWRRLATLIGGSRLSSDERFTTPAARNAHYAEAMEIVRNWTLSQSSRDACLAALDEAGVPSAPVQTIEEVVKDPQIHARGMLVEQEHPVLGKVTLPNLPFRFSDCDTTVRTPAPLLGQDNCRIAMSLGLSAELVEAMVRDGVLYNEAAVQE
ncbi:crotonobetainyl-CoA:carnitine CoA-transferase CaiB-like acyl-CoA transferase [Bradyrhizobium sp. cir1]|uniref:CaiB/BaiF CoA transferase family protein n=1 Tax=Bradyrhizobium sp. cir1 TaxID=1445730 RepID=UPI001606DDA2|nr:CoA transferase [Bradyrhizobium sp. cir1]MBB4371782.1 crotonobetainyl-CoA:carnitine CoA-transferase CaiB-like acyl-CoA transferase [Bradyrhizobium sp. cir1]